MEQLRNNVWIAPYYEDDVKLLAATIGVDKILFGSDWPHGEGLADPTTFTADIPQFPEFSLEDTRKVMRDNALDLLGDVTGSRPASASGVGVATAMTEWTIGAVIDAIAETVPDRQMTVCGNPAHHLRRGRGPHPAAGQLPGRPRAGRPHANAIELNSWECGQDRVALIMHNDLYPDMVIGCLKARTVPVNVNYYYSPGEVADLLAYLRPRAIIYHRSLGAEVRFPCSMRGLLISRRRRRRRRELPGAVRLGRGAGPGGFGLCASALARRSADDLYRRHHRATQGVLWRQGDIYVVLDERGRPRGGRRDPRQGAPTPGRRGSPSPR